MITRKRVGKIKPRREGEEDEGKATRKRRRSHLGCTLAADWRPVAGRAGTCCASEMFDLKPGRCSCLVGRAELWLERKNKGDNNNNNIIIVRLTTTTTTTSQVQDVT